MKRRSFLRNLIAAVACAAIPAGMKPLNIKRSVSDDRIEKIETPFGTIFYKRHPLFRDINPETFAVYSLPKIT